MVETVELLDGRKMQVTAPLGVIKPGQEQTIYGEGMPIRKDGSVNLKKKGDMMNVKWEVVFPDKWTYTQLRFTETGSSIKEGLDTK